MGNNKKSKQAKKKQQASAAPAPATLNENGADQSVYSH